MVEQTKRAAIVVFDLWCTTAYKGVRVSDELKRHFELSGIADFDVRYEKAIQLKAWSDERALAEGFLVSFGLRPTEDSILFVSDIVSRAMASAVPAFDVLSIVEELKSTRRVGLLSNTTNIESRKVDEWKFGDLFEIMIYSWQTGVLKPAPESFRAISDAFGVEPQRIVLVDDRKANIEGARAIGFDAIHFTDAKNLRREFAQRDIHCTQR